MNTRPIPLPKVKAPRFIEEDLDYVLIYAGIIVWACLFAAFIPSSLVPVFPQPVPVLLASVAVSGAALGILGISTRDNLRTEYMGLLMLIGVPMAYALTQVVVSFVFIFQGNTDRVALSVFACLPVLFLNKRRRFLVRRRKAAQAEAHR